MNLYGLIMTVLLSTSTGGVQTVIIPAENPDYLRLVEQGRAEYRSGHFVASERLFVAALGILERGDEVNRAATLAELGNAYISKDELSKAERAYLESLAIYKRLSEKSDTLHLLHNLGATYSLEGCHDEATRLLQQALKLA